MLFREILGQDRAVNTLRQAWANDRMAHAYLFTGPEGVGKKLTALTLAQALFCKFKSSEPCGNCPGCLKVKNSCHPDLYILSSGTAAIKIDQIRWLQKQIMLKGVEGDKKMAVLEGAEKMTPEAANAFLKTLEEPPPDTFVILITSQPSALLGTISSRCQLIRFLPLSRENMFEILKRQKDLSMSEASLLADLVEDGMDHALSLASGSIEERINRAVKLMEISNNPTVSSLFDVSKELSEDREEVEEVLWILQTAGRRALIMEYDTARMERDDDVLWKIFRSLPKQACLEILDIIQKTKVSVAKNGNMRLALEVMVIEFRRIREKFTTREGSKIQSCRHKIQK